MFRKLTTLLLVLAMMLAVLPMTGMAEDLPPVELDWYFGQTEMPDSELVNEAINEYLTEKINTKVNLHFWAGTENWDRMRTMISAGQDVGIIGFGSQTQLDYVSESQRGAYYPLNDLMEEYGQGIKALFNQGIWDAMAIDGNIYGIPTLKDNGYFISLIYNDTMAQELGIDVENFEFNGFRDLEALAREAKEKRDAAHPEWAEYPILWSVDRIHPYNFAIENFLNDSFYAVCNLPGIPNIAGVDTETVTNLYDTPEFLEYAIQKQKLVEDGIYAYDYTDRTEWQYTGAIFGWVGWGYTYMEKNMFGPNFETKMRMFDNMWTDTNNFYSAGTAISSKCANPERAMMVLNLVNTDPKLATMLRFGIEGKHYMRDAEGKMTFAGSSNEDPSNRAYYHWYAAPLGNLTIVEAPETLTGPDGIMLKNMIEYNNSCIQAAHLGFVFDISNVKTEVAALASVEAEYQSDLALGQLSSEDEVREIVAEFKDKLKANGVDKVIAEMQAQLDAWKAAR